MSNTMQYRFVYYSVVTGVFLMKTSHRHLWMSGTTGVCCGMRCQHSSCAMCGAWVWEKERVCRPFTTNAQQCEGVELENPFRFLMTNINFELPKTDVVVGRPMIALCVTHSPTAIAAAQWWWPAILCIHYIKNNTKPKCNCILIWNYCVRALLCFSLLCMCFFFLWPTQCPQVTHSIRSHYMLDCNRGQSTQEMSKCNNIRVSPKMYEHESERIDSHQMQNQKYQSRQMVIYAVPKDTKYQLVVLPISMRRTIIWLSLLSISINAHRTKKISAGCVELFDFFCTCLDWRGRHHNLTTASTIIIHISKFDGAYHWESDV